jgi:hypothetical protein
MSTRQSRVGSCPLFAAVLPLRYAVGPTAQVDTSAHDIPSLNGTFPELGPRHPDLTQRALNYTARLLRDGWLYVWESNPPQLVEYEVQAAQLTQTPRAGKVIDNRVKPHLLLRAGDPAGLVWSPVRWSDPQYLAAKSEPAVRERIMRSFVPGAGPLSGKIQAVADYIGEYNDEIHYGWSAQPETEHAPNWVKLIDQMEYCEQQCYAVIDDPWGVIFDLATLIRVRQAAFDNYQEHHAETWALASVIKSLSENDTQLAKQLPSITRYAELQRAWTEQDTQSDKCAADLRRLALMWVDWFNTLQVTGPASLDTACGHFDISVPQAREELETHFAVACLGPASTGVGAAALNLSLEGDQPGKPWLLWALLGLPARLSVGDIKYLVDLGDVVKDNAGTVSQSVTQLANAFTTALNKTASKIAQHAPTPIREALFLSLAPVVGPQLHAAEKVTGRAAHLYMGAALARSEQRIQTSGVSPRQMGEWYSDLMGTRSTPPTSMSAAPLSSAVSDGLPFMHLVPASTKLPPLPVNLASNMGLTSVFDVKSALDKAPIKCLVTLMAGLNFVWAGSGALDSKTAKSAFGAFGALVGVGAAGAAVMQQVAEIDWQAAVKHSGEFSASSQIRLVDALGRTATVSLAMAAFLAFDVVLYGIDAFDAYRAGDFDSVAANLAVSSASLASLVLNVQAYRALRAARAAVIAGDAAAIAKGLNQVPHLGAKLTGLAVVIVAGVIARLYTKDTPLEQWVKQGRFGTHPDDSWAGSYSQSMDKLYPILYPVTFQASRLQETHPMHGTVYSTYVLLKLPGEQVELTEGMVSFKGTETWGDTVLAYKDRIKSVSWTGKDFQRHTGSRVPVEPGLTVYRRVYHEEGMLDLRSIEGELIYSPQEGLTLPTVTIKEHAWI